MVLGDNNEDHYYATISFMKLLSRYSDSTKLKVKYYIDKGPSYIDVALVDAIENNKNVIIILRKKDEVKEMELKNTIEMMNSEDFKERFKAEYYQVKIRRDKLYEMLNKLKDGTLNFKPKCSYELLHEQAIYMNNYIEVLEARAEIEGIEL